jgi:hypothetical protein
MCSVKNEIKTEKRKMSISDYFSKTHEIEAWCLIFFEVVPQFNSLMFQFETCLEI